MSIEVAEVGSSPRSAENRSHRHSQRRLLHYRHYCCRPC